MFNIVLLILLLFSLLNALLTGRASEAGAAVLEGARSATGFALELCGALCLWSAILELAERCGLTKRLAAALRPLLRRLFPCSSREAPLLEALSENLSANLLGLGSAATPAGIRAARGMAGLGEAGVDELRLLVVLNTASLQLLPTTIASVRSSLGASSPFDIVPAVLLSSLLSVLAGLGAAKLLQRVWR